MLVKLSLIFRKKSPKKSEISLLSKGLKFVPTHKWIDRLSLNKSWRFLGENLDRCGIFEMMKEKLTAIKGLGQRTWKIL